MITRIVAGYYDENNDFHELGDMNLQPGADKGGEEAPESKQTAQECPWPSWKYRLEELAKTAANNAAILKSARLLLKSGFGEKAGTLQMLSQVEKTLKSAAVAFAPKINELAEDFLHPAPDISFEFGMHSPDDDAYLNYTVVREDKNGDEIEFDVPKYEYVDNLLFKTASNIAKKANEFECRDDDEDKSWNVASEPTFYDSDGEIIEDDDLSHLDLVAVIQYSIMRLDY